MLATLAVTATLALTSGTTTADPATIASHYAGTPVTVVRGGTDIGYGKTFGAPWVNDNRIWLHDALYDSLYDPRIFQPGRQRFVKTGYTTDADDWDVIALHVLIHEALHHRNPDAPEGAVDCAAVFLVPSALERFYGIPIGSRQGKALWWFRGTYPLDCGWWSK